MTEIITFISIFLTGILLIVLWNMWVFRKRKYNSIPKDELPFVSVLIPARNEERSIRECVESLLDQDYKKFEVIVLNDNSEDGTGMMLEELRNKYKELKVINGKPLPAGWSGKNYACHQLYKASKGEYILFTDADTVHFKDSILNSVTRSINRKADLYTLIPKMTLNSFAEKLIMPGIHFTSFTLLPYYLAETLKSPAFAMGVGPFLLFRREAYEAIGGHEALKNDLVEDVRLAKNIKRFGYKVVVNKGLDILSCRMYQSFKEIWEGFSKNIFPGMGYSSLTLFSVFFVYLILFFMPFAGAMVSLVTGNEYLLYNFLYQVVLLIIMRVIINSSFKLGFISTLLHPAGVLIISMIGFNSWRWNKIGKGSLWKGRTYSEIMLKGETL
ncbi:MAG: glycosyltransferase [Ignavibacteria bacterium]